MLEHAKVNGTFYKVLRLTEEDESFVSQSLKDKTSNSKN